MSILEQPVIEKILTHLGLDPQPPPKGVARESRPHFAGWPPGPCAGAAARRSAGRWCATGSAQSSACADIDGFSLHAAVRVKAHDRKRLEQLCCYITRPALSDERVQLNASEQLELKLKTPWRDGTTHLVMSPMEFMQRHIDGQLCGIEFCDRYVR